MYRAKIVLVLVVFLVRSALCEVFTSIDEIGQMIGKEKEIVSLLEDYLHQEMERISIIREYVQQHRRVKNGTVTLESVATNPIHALHMVRRYTDHLDQIHKRMMENTWTDTRKRIKSINFGGKRASGEDLTGVTKSMILIQTTYNLTAADLANGIIWGVHTGTILTSEECLNIVAICFRTGNIVLALEWMDVILVKVIKEGETLVSKEKVIAYISSIIAAHDQLLENAKSANITHPGLFPEPLKEVPLLQQRAQLASRTVQYKLGLNLTEQELHENFKALCQGKDILPKRIRAGLRCWLDRARHPYFTIRPIKLEQAYVEPPVFLVHDIISESEANHLKGLALPELQRSRTGGMASSGLKSDYRTSKQTWLEDEDAETRRITHRVSMILQLPVDIPSGMAELLQVVNYGVAGQYYLHTDHASKPGMDRTKGSYHGGNVVNDRYYTFMYYLSNVTRGGATVFPQLGITVWPKKGTAVFWRNLKKVPGKHLLEGDDLTHHGGCPIVLGTKWVANKWVREMALYYQLRPLPRVGEPPKESTVENSSASFATSPLLLILITAACILS